MIWESVFFDFDGVIADSADIKTKAFARIFAGYGPDIEKKIINYHLLNEGISRFEKFRYFYKNILLKDICEKELKHLGKKFSKLVLEEVLVAPFMEGAIETLEQLKQKHIPSYIVSGTPQDEIIFIVKKKNISNYFIELHGSPRQKDEIINDILKRHCHQPIKCLFVGDAMSDYNAARKTGLYFLGVVKENKKSPFPNGTDIISKITIESPLIGKL